MSLPLSQIHKTLGLMTRMFVTSPRKIRGEAMPSWDICQQKCTSNYLSSDLNREIAVDQLRTRAREIHKSAYSRLTALIGIAIGNTPRTHSRIRVVDFGGGAGLHWWEAKCTFGDIFDWVVIETSSLIDAVKYGQIDQPAFATNIEDAKTLVGGIDLCIVSGSLQYCPQPMQEIARLAAARANCYLMLRTPVLTSDQAEFAGKFWVQSAKFIHHISYPTLNQSIFRNTQYPVTFLAPGDLAVLDADHDRFLEFSEGPLYELSDQDQTIEGRTTLWIKK